MAMRLKFDNKIIHNHIQIIFIDVASNVFFLFGDARPCVFTGRCVRTNNHLERIRSSNKKNEHYNMQFKYIFAQLKMQYGYFIRTIRTLS